MIALIAFVFGVYVCGIGFVYSLVKSSLDFDSRTPQWIRRFWALSAAMAWPVMLVRGAFEVISECWRRFR